MKKTTILRALLAVTPMFIFADSHASAPKEPITVVPVMKEDKGHHDTKKHEAANVRHAQKGHDEYVKEIEAKIKETKALVEAEKTKADPELYVIASLKVAVAENWLKTIQGYKDSKTRYVRSVKYAIDELKMAKKTINARLDKDVISETERVDAIAKLKVISENLAKDKDVLTLHEDNAACFATLLKSANDYIDTAAKVKSNKSVKSLIKRAKKYHRDIKAFLNAHKPHEHHGKGRKKGKMHQTADAHATTMVAATSSVTTKAA